MTFRISNLRAKQRRSLVNIDNARNFVITQKAIINPEKLSKIIERVDNKVFDLKKKKGLTFYKNREFREPITKKDFIEANTKVKLKKSVNFKQATNELSK